MQRVATRVIALNFRHARHAFRSLSTATKLNSHSSIQYASTERSSRGYFTTAAPSDYPSDFDAGVAECSSNRANAVVPAFGPLHAPEWNEYEESVDCVAVSAVEKGPDANVAIDIPDVVGLAAGTTLLGGFGVYGAEMITYVRDTLSSVAMYTGTDIGWSATLLATAVSIRLITFPLMYFHQHHIARAVSAAPEIRKVHVWIRKSPGALLQRYASWRRLRALALQSAGTRSIYQYPWYLFIHIPMLVSSSLGTRCLIDSKAAEMAAAGPSWASDLTAVDPTGILPAAAVSLWILNVHRVKAPKDESKKTSEKELLRDANEKQKKDLLIKLISARTSEWMVTGVQALALLSFPYVLNVPSGVALLWTANASCTLVQRQLFRADSTRSIMGLPTILQMQEASVRGTPDSGPNILGATADAMKKIRQQLTYVRNEVLTRYKNRRVDDKLAGEITRALQREVERGRIGIQLAAEVQKEDVSGRKYIAVVAAEKIKSKAR